MERGEALKLLRCEREGVPELNRLLDSCRLENREFSIDLSEANLSELDLSGANLSGATLNKSDLSGSTLNKCQLSKAILREANLAGADLREAECVETNLNKANLRLADLSNANLRLADLSEANLTAADLNWANLIEARICEADLTEAKLGQTCLHRADLSRACLVGAELNGANLNWSDLNGANLNLAYLRGANLNGVDLSGADLNGADLSGAVFIHVNFSGAELGQTNFNGAKAAGVLFCDIDLSTAINVDCIGHLKPSTVGVDTIVRSGGEIPELFLRGCGVPDSFITYQRSLVSNPIEFYSCFISYSHANKSFARRMHDQLQSRGIRCWLDEHAMVPGDDIYAEVDQGIRLWDKVLFCASRDSLQSWWVDREIDTAIEKEMQLHKKGKRGALSVIPLNLDGSLFSSSGKHAATLRKRLAADFTGWESDNAKFEAQFERVVKALQIGSKREPPEPKL